MERYGNPLYNDDCPLYNRCTINRQLSLYNRRPCTTERYGDPLYNDDCPLYNRSTINRQLSFVQSSSFVQRSDTAILCTTTIFLCTIVVQSLYNRRPLYNGVIRQSFVQRRFSYVQSSSGHIHVTWEPNFIVSVWTIDVHETSSCKRNENGQVTDR